MDQKTLLAIGLSMLVLIGFYALFPQPQPERPAEAPGAGLGPEAGRPEPSQATAAAAVPSAARRRAAAPEREARFVRVETPRYVAKISTREGTLASLALKDYRVGMDTLNWGDIIPPLAQYFDEPDFDPSQRVEMVQRLLTGPGMLGLTFVENSALTEEFQNLIFTADRNRLTLEAGGAPEAVYLEGQTASGLTVRKTIEFDPESYVLHYTVSVVNYGDTAQPLRVQHMFGEGAVPTTGGRPVGYSHVGPLYRVDDSLETEDAEDLERLLPVRDPEWVGIAEPYFLSAVAPESTIGYAFYQAERNPEPDLEPEWIARYGMELPVVTLEPNKQIQSAFRIYLGPKDEEELLKFGGELRDALDITLDVLAKPLLVMLRWFHSYTGNWGVAIILLTLVVRVALFPLTYKGMVSMKRMQKLQPKVAALKEKFKNDKEKMNREMMGMYKRYRINPLGGCLPILLQLPVFFALYSALGTAIELRHTPFIGWITDLSAMDGLFVLPLLMGASMFFQQKLTPSSLDPTQQKIMMWMPAIFMVFMMTFPSGLVLYWFTSNLLSILQQLVINRVKVPEPVERAA